MRSQLVSKHNLLSVGYRFDAGYHLSEGVSIRRWLQDSGLHIQTIGDCALRIFYGIRANRVYVTKRENAIPFMTGANIMLANLRNCKLVSSVHTPAIEEMTIHKGWIMVTRSGTVGQTAFSSGIHEGKYGSEDIIRIIPNGSIRPGVIYAYLASKYGQTLLTQGAFGAVIQHIEPSFIEKIQIPVFPQELQDKVDMLVVESAKLREEAISAFNSAIKIFEENFVKSKFDFSYQTKDISSALISGAFKRFDAQYQIGMLKLRKELSGVKTVKLSKLASKIYVGNRGKRYYVKSGIPFLSSSDMMLYNPVKYSTPISVNTPNLETLLVNTNDILISRSGTVGNSVIVSDTLNRKAVSEHALRLVIDNLQIDPKYVFCYLNTAHGKRVLEALSYGSIIITLGEEFVGDIDIPILNPEIQSAINEAIRLYSSYMDKSILFDNQAVKLIETCIEDNY